MIFKTKKMLGYGIYPAFFILFLIFFNNCQDQYDDYFNDRYDDRYDSRDSGGSYRRNNSDLRTVNTHSSVRFEPISKRQFDGNDCEESDECQDLCNEIYSGLAQEKCENLPEDMVEVLYETYEDLRYASLESLREMDPSALAVLIDMDDKMINFLREDWGIRGVSAIIDYTASNPLAVEAFKYGDNEEIFKSILLEFARLKLQSSRSNRTASLSTALSLNVVRYRETMLTLIKNADNIEAVQFVFDLVREECLSPLHCKQQILCVREDISRRSSRDRSGECPYLGPRDRSDYCYIQGPDVWGYIENLIYDGHLNDLDLMNLDFTEEMCNSFCSRNNCYL